MCWLRVRLLNAVAIFIRYSLYKREKYTAIVWPKQAAKHKRNKDIINSKSCIQFHSKHEFQLCASVSISHSKMQENVDSTNKFQPIIQSRNSKIAGFLSIILFFWFLGALTRNWSETQAENWNNQKPIDDYAFIQNWRYKNSRFFLVLLTFNANVSHRIKWLQWKVLQRMSNSIIYSLISLELKLKYLIFNKWIERQNGWISNECLQAIESHQHQQMRECIATSIQWKYSWLIHEKRRIETQNQSIRSEFQRQINALARSTEWETERENIYCNFICEVYIFGVVCFFFGASELKPSAMVYGLKAAFKSKPHNRNWVIKWKQMFTIECIRIVVRAFFWNTIFMHP